ncbi:hypothetical protein RhiirA4_483526, partial [Rhizophagus irregularis]
TNRVGTRLVSVLPVISSDTKEREDINNIKINNKNSDLEEVKVQIIVKSNIIKVSMAKTLNIEPISYKKIMEKINLSVQKILKKKSNQKIILYHIRQ